MARRDHEFWRLRAGEYVLGTLSDRKRRQFERLRDRDAYYCDMADDWERRFTPLAETLQEVAPSPDVWVRIQSSIQKPPLPKTLWDRLGFWRGFGIAAAGLAVCLLVFIVMERLVPPTPGALGGVAVLNDKASAATWLVTVGNGGRRLAIRPLMLVEIPAGKSLELWLIGRKGEKPLSLGRIPVGGRRSVNLSEAAVKSWPRASSLAITLEPKSGWRPGTPLGPVLYIGKVQLKVGR